MATLNISTNLKFHLGKKTNDNYLFLYVVSLCRYFNKRLADCSLFCNILTFYT